MDLWISSSTPLSWPWSRDGRPVEASKSCLLACFAACDSLMAQASESRRIRCDAERAGQIPRAWFSCVCCLSSSLALAVRSFSASTSSSSCSNSSCRSSCRRSLEAASLSNSFFSPMAFKATSSSRCPCFRDSRFRRRKSWKSNCCCSNSFRRCSFQLLPARPMRSRAIRLRHFNSSFKHCAFCSSRNANRASAASNFWFISCCLASHCSCWLWRRCWVSHSTFATASSTT
mmetsp:Transcript_71631/g.158256  ORF Transcript_71631/g.158256 Transcript_71631/m.158256 type:complete len:231 (+) Transcript_71631:102-794(+)